jgi:Holliday junction DNA helicase RuvA
MIAFLRGIVFKVNSDSIYLDHDGMGFRVFMSTRDLAELVKGDEVFVYTYLQVKEDDMSLYGFLSEDDMDLFKKLIGVSGVGPKIGLSVLSSYTVSDINFAILSDDDKTLSKVSGLGAKTAKKIILELKDKIDMEEAVEINNNDEGISSSAKNDATLALTSLGYSSSDALKAMSKIENVKELSTEEIIKEALKILSFGL